jgi:hypothetical protein
MASALLQIKVEAYRIALEKMTGISPDIAYRADGRAVVFWSEPKAAQLRSWLNGQLSRRPSTPSDIDFQIVPAIRPLLAKKIAPYAAALIGAGLIGGLLAGKYL